MLALRRLRCLLHSTPASQIRQLRTKPPSIPQYAKRWGPTLYRPHGQVQSPKESSKSSQTGALQLLDEQSESTQIETLQVLDEPSGPTQTVTTQSTKEQLERTQEETLQLRNESFVPTSSMRAKTLQLLNEPSGSVVPTQSNAGEEASFSTADKQYYYKRLTERVCIDVGKCSSSTQRTITKLEYLLNSADIHDDLRPDVRVPLWHAYKLALKHRPKMVTRRMPQRGWNIIWRAQYKDFSNVSKRQVRLAQIDRDMTTGRAAPVAGQIALRAEKTFMAGGEENALSMWETSYHKFATAPEYLDTGTRLYALAGLPDIARKHMDDLLKLEPDWDVSLLTAVFRAYTSSSLQEHHDEAKKIYQSIKARICHKDDLGTYDACMVGFLQARSLADARQVFRDMVCGGSLNVGELQPGFDVTRPKVTGVLRRLNLMYPLATDVSSMTTIALDAIDVLPNAYHSHIFTDWMKLAIADRTPQAAAQILDLMIQRGYQPETNHFNMLLRALFRSDESEDIEKALSIAWKMIEESQRSSVAAERPLRGRVYAIAEKVHGNSILDVDTVTAIPAASATTFALVMRHHAERNEWENVDFLARQLSEAKVQPNDTIMNVLIENKGLQGKFVEAWQIYKTLTDHPDQAVAVFPNGESMRILWRTLRLALRDPENRKDPNLPTPRQLLRETFEWWVLVRQRPDFDRFLQGLAAENLQAITKLVLHCFSFVQDLPGALVALHFLREKFGIKANSDHAGIFVRMQAWTVLDDESESVRIQFGLGTNHQQSMRKFRKLYRRLHWNRLQRQSITQEDLESYSEKQLAELELNVISEFTRTILINRYDFEEAEHLIQEAANAAGVPYIDTGDMTVWDMAEDAHRQYLGEH